jgi:predicted SnoaL-like aldol condensation-catalyzing enzyme
MNETTSPIVLQKWHRIAESGDPAGLAELLADDAVFHSPVVHRPQEGKALVTLYLSAAATVLGNNSFKYVREIVDGQNAVLEFVCEVDGITINGVDLIRWNDDDRIVDFKVMVRPLKGVNMIHQKMMAMLEAFQGDK